MLPPPHLQGLVFRVAVAVDHPYGPFPGHFFIDDDFFHRTVLLPDPADILCLPAARIEGDDRSLAPVEFLREGPVDLHVRAGQGFQECIPVQGARSVLFPDFGSEQVAERGRVGRHPGSRRTADARAGGFEHLSHGILLVVTIAGRGGDGVPDLGNLVLSDWDGGEDACYLVQSENKGFSRFVGGRIDAVQPLAGGDRKGAGQAPEQDHTLHLYHSGFAARFHGYKVPEIEPCSQKGKRIKLKIGLPTGRKAEISNAFYA